MEKFKIIEMKIGILAAMDKEIDLLLPLMDNAEVAEIDGVKAFTGKIHDHEVCLMKCGIGKVNSALNAFRIIERFSPELIINSGVAGGADASMKIGSLLIAEEAAYHDVWCGPGTEPGSMDGVPPRLKMDDRVIEKSKSLPGCDTFRYGLIATGDKFISTPEEIYHIKSLYPDALACDMESAAIAHACFEKGIPFAVLRVVSDTPGQADNISQYTNFFSEAPEKTFRTIRTLLEIL